MRLLICLILFASADEIMQMGKRTTKQLKVPAIQKVVDGWFETAVEWQIHNRKNQMELNALL